MTIQRLKGSIKTSKVVVSSEDVIRFSNQSVFPEHNDLNDLNVATNNSILFLDVL